MKKNRRKLAIVTTHVVQYYAPWFQMLALRNVIDVKVFYTWSQSQKKKFDEGFGKVVQWDIPLLEGYEHEFVQNTSSRPGLTHFDGLVNPDLVQKIEEWGATAILVIGWNYRSHFGAMRYFKGRIPVIFRGDSHLLDETGGWRTWLRRRVLRFVYRFVDTALYVGQNNKAYYEKHGLKNHQLVFAPHAIDNQRFARSAEQQQQAADAWRKNLDIDAEKVVVLFSGKFEQKKQPGLLVEAAKNKKFQSVHFILIGNGSLEQRLKKEAAGLSNVTFLPFQNQSKMPQVYRLAQVFTLPSQGPGETWGLAVNEAMACGRAVLVSNKVGCATDLVENGKNGYIFEAGNSADFQNKLAEIIHNKEFIEQAGQYSQKQITEWNFEKICETIENNVD